MMKYLMIGIACMIMPMASGAQVMSSENVFDTIDRLTLQMTQCHQVTLGQGKIHGYDDQWLSFHYLNCIPGGRLETYTSYNDEQNRQRDALFAVLNDWLEDNPRFKKISPKHSKFDYKSEIVFVRIY